MRLFSCLLDEVNQQQTGAEISAQVVIYFIFLLINFDFVLVYFFPKKISLWIQGLFLFSLVWGLGGTLNNDSRKKFDVFFREVLNNNDKYPKPKSVKLSKVLILNFSIQYIVFIFLSN